MDEHVVETPETPVADVAAPVEPAGFTGAELQGTQGVTLEPAVAAELIEAGIIDAGGKIVPDPVPVRTFTNPRVCEVSGLTHEAHEGSATAIGWVSFEAQRAALGAASADPATAALTAARDARLGKSE